MMKVAEQMSQSLKFQSRMDAVQPPIVPVLGEIIRQVPGTISLGQGVVHYGPPPEALEKIHAALGSPATHEYQDGAGLPLLLDAIARKLAAENGIAVGRGTSVMVTAGANMAFMHAVFAITEPGDEVILNVPFYFNHEMAIQMAGCTPVRVAMDARYQLRPEALRRAITDRTRAIVTVSPNNPTGAVLSEASLREISAICRERGIFHISDEVYEYFTYGSARHFSPASLPGADAFTISMYSLSKAYGFAGWRIGYVAYPDHLSDAMMKSQDTILVCPTVASQVGAAAALEVGRSYSVPHVRELAAIRDIVVRQLAALEPLASVPAAEGAFYCLLRVDTDMDPLVLAERLIREHRVAVVPGPAFGMTDGCYFRVAYGALRKETVTQGIGRLVDGLRRILDV
jgi:aspartate/methionine/tyrosine aminotransferase